MPADDEMDVYGLSTLLWLQTSLATVPLAGCQTPSKWKRSASMVPAGPDDANLAHLMVDDVIQEDDDESDGTSAWDGGLSSFIAK